MNQLENQVIRVMERNKASAELKAEDKYRELYKDKMFDALLNDVKYEVLWYLLKTTIALF